jgi:hypothetical protein
MAASLLACFACCPVAVASRALSCAAEALSWPQDWLLYAVGLTYAGAMLSGDAAQPAIVAATVRAVIVLMIVIVFSGV